MGISDFIAIFSSPEVRITITLTKAIISLLKTCFSEDVKKVLRMELAGSELDAAKSVIDSLEYEAEQNWKNGLNRAVTHLESAFEIYTRNGEFASACVCALYLSCLHWSVGNVNPELFVRIWTRVPILSSDSVEFGEFSSLAQKVIPEESYQELCLIRNEKYAEILEISKKIDALKGKMPSYGLMPGGVGTIATATIRSKIEILEEQKRKIQNLKDNRSDMKKYWDVIKPWWLG